jgi:multidrug efflux pump subunit AcrB
MILTEYSIKFRVTVFSLVAVLLVAGPLVYFTMPREGSPDVTIPMVFVSAPYEGVAPEEIENLITIPLEKRFNGLEHIKELTSTSSEGVALVAIEFTAEQNIDAAVQKVKDKIDLARPDLPRDLDEPTVQGFNFSTDIPVFTMAIAGDPDLERLKHVAEDLQDVIEELPGVLQARLLGVREREIRVEVDLARLMAYRLTLGELTAAIRGGNATVSAGNLEISGQKVQMRVPGEFAAVNELRDVVVAVRDDRLVRLTDVAAITDTYKDLSSISRINGEPCISIAVHKRAGENADKLIRHIKRALAANPLPPGLRATYVEDQSEMIRLMIEDLENNIVSGFVLVVAILFLFMGVRNSLLVGLAIPFSLMAGFLALSAMGITLNMLVLFSLVLTVGMLVDNAIVIVENIYRRHAEGESKLDAALHGAAEVAWPVTTSTLTTLAAFWPMIYWPGIMGQFMSFLPKTVIVILTASLFVALVINPALCSVFVTRPLKPDSIEEPTRWLRFTGAYERVLRAALAHRGLVTAIGLVFLVLTVLAFRRYGNGLELFPDVPPQRASIEVRFPEGTDIQTTDRAVRAIEAQLAAYRDIKFFLTNVGSAGDWALSAAAGTHLGSIRLEFVPFGERHTNTLEMVESIRRDIGAFPGAQVTLKAEEMGPPTDAPVTVELSGDDFGALAELADRVVRELKAAPGLVDVRDNMEDARQELQFRVDRQKAALLGLDTDSVGQFLRTAINGEEVSKFRAGEDEYDITVRLRSDQRRSVDLLKQIAITVPGDRRVPLEAVGAFTYEGGRGQILRKDQKRTITITANTVKGVTVDEVIRGEIAPRLAKVAFPKGYTVSFAGDTKEMNEALVFLGKALLIALALIALILIMEFNSIMQPFMIMFAVLLSMAGVMWGLLLCHMRFGVIMTGIGVVSLAGVVVNNGIVLIDCINQRRAGGVPVEEAILVGGRTRLRPVLLTALTTVAGLVPMAVGWSLEIHAWPPKFVAGAETSAWWAPMAVAVIFGLTLATLLTLVQVPVMYSLLHSLSGRIQALSQRREAE